MISAVFAIVKPMLLPLLPAKLRPYAKFIAAAFGAILTVALAHYAGHVPANVSAVLTPLAVLLQPNEKIEEVAEEVVDTIAEMLHH